MKTPEQIVREVFDLHWRDMTTTQIAVEAVKADRAQRAEQIEPAGYERATEEFMGQPAMNHRFNHFTKGNCDRS